MWILQCVVGTVIVLVTLYDVFLGVVVPRWTGRRLRLAPQFSAWLWPRWKRLNERLHEERRPGFLAAFAPFTLFALLAMWASLLLLGFAITLHALRGEIKDAESFGDALYLAGVAFFTIGFGDIVAQGALPRTVTLAAGATGLVLTALVISLTFTLYSTFSRREALILTLDARAGSPPSGVSLLETYAQFELLDELPALFDRWETWTAEVLESHLAYPLLPFFRSAHENSSWSTGLGAVLDAATLLISSVEPGRHCGQRPIGSAHLMFHLGCHAIDDLSLNLFARRADFEAEVQKETPDPGITREQFQTVLERLQKTGFELRPLDEAWESFAHHRAVYSHRLEELERYYGTPPSPWAGERSALSFASETEEHPKAAEIADAEIADAEIADK
jgi:hypothetical protein